MSTLCNLCITSVKTLHGWMLPPQRKLFIFDEIYWSLLYFMTQTTNLVKRNNVRWYFYHSIMHLANDTVKCPNFDQLSFISFLLANFSIKSTSKTWSFRHFALWHFKKFWRPKLGSRVKVRVFVGTSAQHVQIWWNNKILNNSIIKTMWISQVKNTLYNLMLDFLLLLLIKLVEFKHLFYLYKFIITHTCRESALHKFEVNFSLTATI